MALGLDHAQYQMAKKLVSRKLVELAPLADGT
jgi:hypothetical protein